jgi:hypothetical protein
MAQTIQFKRGNEANLPTLDAGEPAVTLDSGRLFVGTPSGNVEIATISEFDETVTVGSNGQYPTINTALAALAKKYPSYKKNGVNVELKLKSGFVMQEQVSVKRTNLGWITITSEDAIVIVERSAITEVLVESNRRPLFAGVDNAVLPTIGVLFEYNGAPAALTDGITVSHGSKVQLLPGAGVNKADRGLGAYYNSEAFCYMPSLTEGGAGSGAGTTKGVEFKDCSGRALMASFGSKINCARSQLQNCKGDLAVYVIWGSQADIYQSDISNATNTAVHARDGSFINARETNVCDANRGYHALHNARINARYDSTGWSGEGAKRCKDYAVLASYNSHIDASRLPMDGSKIGAHASNASSISIIDGATATGCVTGVYAVGASNIDCYGINVSNCTNIGILSEDGSSINAAGAIANTCTVQGFKARGSMIYAENGQANTCGEGFTASYGGKIIARGGSAQNCSKGIVGFEMGDIDASSVNTTGSPTGFSVARGSRVVAYGSTGVLSQAANTTTSNGIIYQ